MGISDGIRVLIARKQRAIIALYIFLVAMAIYLLGEVLELAGVIDMNAIELSTLTAVFAVFYVAQLPVLIGCIVVVAMWIHRAHTNLIDAGHSDLEFSPGWAVGWYFIPIANLFKPFQAMKELWNTSFGLSNDFGGEAPFDIKAWWGCWILGNIIGWQSTRLSLNDDAGAYQISLIMGVVSSILSIAAAYYLIGMIREITNVQEQEIGVQDVFA